MSEFFLDKETREDIEWEAFLALIEVSSPLGLRFKHHLQPFLPPDKNSLRQELKRTALYSNLLGQREDLKTELLVILGELKDLRLSLRRSNEGMTLTVTELFEIKRLLFFLSSLKELLKREEFSFLARFRPKGAKRLFNILNKGNQSPLTFYLVDEYSPRLKKLRREKAQARSSLEDSLNLKKEELALQGYKLSSSGEITVMRNSSEAEKISKDNRFLFKRESPGYMTFSLRPSTEDLQWQERLQEIGKEEEEEEKLILQKLSKKVAELASSLLEDLEKVAYLDFLTGKARLSLEYQGALPTLIREGNKKAINIEGGVHYPMALRLKERGKSFQGLTLSLNIGSTLLTGANMSGKTVLLKTVGLLVAIAQHGMLVPAKSFRFQPFDYIFFSTRRKDQDGLSAFGAEISGLKKVLQIKDKRGLLLIDELARGTNPKEGFAINAAILTYLSQMECVALLTTHFDRLAGICPVEHLQMAGIPYLSMEEVKLLSKGADSVLEKMDYRVEKVSDERPVPHDALKIALLLGLEESVVELAEKFLEEN